MVPLGAAIKSVSIIYTFINTLTTQVVLVVAARLQSLVLNVIFKVTGLTGVQ